MQLKSVSDNFNTFYHSLGPSALWPFSTEFMEISTNDLTAI